MWQAGTYLYGATTLERQLQAILESALAADTARAAAIVVGLYNAMEWIIELEINLQVEARQLGNPLEAIEGPPQHLLALSRRHN